MFKRKIKIINMIQDNGEISVVLYRISHLKWHKSEESNRYEIKLWLDNGSSMEIDFGSDGMECKRVFLLIHELLGKL